MLSIAKVLVWAFGSCNTAPSAGLFLGFLAAGVSFIDVYLMLFSDLSFSGTSFSLDCHIVVLLVSKPVTSILYAIRNAFPWGLSI